MAKYFGTDGIRGRYGLELTNAIAFKVGQTIKSVLKMDKLVIGMDTRESSSELLHSVASGAQSMGVDVMDAGVATTPMISYYSLKKGIAGVMITASHNPYHDNGIKVFYKGTKLSKEQEEGIEQYLDSSESLHVKAVGKMLSGEAVFDTYVDVIDSLELQKYPIRLGIDSANGANYLVAKAIFQEIVEELHQVGNNPNGKNINDGVGSTHLEHIQSLVKREQLDIGFAFDGDGDRILVVDENQEAIDGDLLIYIIAVYLKQQGKLHKDTVVLTKMSNLGIIKALNDKGINVELTNVGDKYVVAAMEKHDYSVGGENSGHIIVRDYLHTGDGIVVGLLLLKILHETKQSLQDLISDVTMWPQVLKNVKTTQKELLQSEKVQTVITQIKEHLGNNGKVLVRPSGTEPFIRVTISCETIDEVTKYIDKITNAIEEAKEETL